MSGQHKVHDLRVVCQGQPAHDEHGDGDDRDVHGRHYHHLIHHGYHDLSGLLSHDSVVISGNLETVVSGKRWPKVRALIDDSEVSTQVISGDSIDCEAKGPICNRDELHHR